MADILSQIQQRQAAAQNQQLAQADTNNTWAQTFSSIPASDKVFAAQDLNDMIAKVTAQKQAAIEASNPAIGLAHARTQEVLDRTKHANEMAPLAVQFKQSQFEAQKALEARRLKEDALANTVKAHEDNFFADRATFQADHPSATQEELDANDISLNARYPHAMKSGSVKEIVVPATRNSLARQNEARKATALQAHNELAAIDAKANNLEFSHIGLGGQHMYAKPGQTLEQKTKERFELSKAGAEGTAAAKPSGAGHTTEAGKSALAVSGAIAEAFNAGQVKFGSLDAATNAVTPNTGSDKATHAQVTFTTPSGKVEKGVFTISQLQKHLSDATGTKPSVATQAVASTVPERTATHPQTGEKLAFRNGKWVPLTQ